MCRLCYLDDWLAILESSTLLLQHQDLVLQLCKDQGIIVNLKLELQLSTHVQHLRLLVDKSLEEVFPSEARLARFRAMATFFLLLTLPQHTCGSRCWATWLRWRVFVLKVARSCILCSGSLGITGSPWWMTRPFRFLCHRSEWRWFVGGFWRTGGGSVSLSGFLLHLCCGILTCVCRFREPTC